MKSFLVLGTLLTLAGVFAGCSGGLVVGIDPAKDGGGSGDDDGSGPSDASGGTGSCATDNDCASTAMCGFLQSQSCEATGKCFPRPLATCLAYSEACACDGTNYNVACTGLPAGYVPKPFLHTKACVDAGATPDTGTTPVSCTTNADCGGFNVCGFPAANGCAAVGECLPPPAGPQCGVYEPGCACDGTPVNLACNGLPASYTTKPLAYAGACKDAGH